MKQAMINYMQQEKNDELYTPDEAIYINWRDDVDYMKKG